MAPNVFSVTVFFLVFRETLEAALIVSVLLSLVKQIVQSGNSPLPSSIDEKQVADDGEDDATRKRRLLRKLRLQV
jgi:high-affinity iron transporter